MYNKFGCNDGFQRRRRQACVAELTELIVERTVVVMCEALAREYDGGGGYRQQRRAYNRGGGGQMDGRAGGAAAAAASRRRATVAAAVTTAVEDDGRRRRLSPGLVVAAVVTTYQYAVDAVRKKTRILRGGFVSPPSGSVATTGASCRRRSSAPAVCDIIHYYDSPAAQHPDPAPTVCGVDEGKDLKAAKPSKLANPSREPPPHRDTLPPASVELCARLSPEDANVRNEHWANAQ
ncbi:hypothetical protein QTP88_006942 [Uroleucon formosanum]